MFNNVILVLSSLFLHLFLNVVFNGAEIANVDPKTIHVLQRKLDKILGVYYDLTDHQIKCRTRTFSDTDGEATIKDIVTALEQSKKVIIDTSRLEDEAELLIGSIITQQILHLYKSLNACKSSLTKR